MGGMTYMRHLPQVTREFVAVLLLTLTLGIPSGAQEPAPDPHVGQPAYCVNHAGFDEYPMEEPHICMCDKPCHEGQPEDRKCLKWCQKDHCHCIAECEPEPPPLAGGEHP